MKSNGLNDKQFITVALVIILCGIAILGHDYFMAKRAGVYNDMSILLSQEPEVVERVNRSVSVSDTSGKVKKINTTYNYVGRIKIPKINLNRGFLKYGQRGNNVNQNVAVMGGSTYPTELYSHLILASHSGSGWNAYFTRIDQLSLGDIAYVTYKNKQYKYKLVRKYKDKKNDGAVNIYRHSSKKHLTLITCKRPDYKTYYLLLAFELVSETKIN